MDVTLRITRKQSKEVRQLLKDRNHYRFLLTNAVLDYLPTKSNYNDEATFYTLSFRIVSFPLSEKVTRCIREIFAHLIMYDFAEMITSHVAIRTKKRKYTYKANFSVAVHACRAYYLRDISSPDLEAIIARNLIPIRPDRHIPRNQTGRKSFQGFLYRIA